VLEPNAIERLIGAHSAGTIDAGDSLWALLNLELWYRTFIDGEGVQTLSVQATSSESPLRATA
jgi:hypothetical protein